MNILIYRNQLLQEVTTGAYLSRDLFENPKSRGLTRSRTVLVSNQKEVREET